MRILTWIQPSWDLHIWNFFWTIQQILEMQENKKDSDEIFMFVADLHSLTTVEDPDVLRTNVKNVILDYLACWLDPDKITLYAQSDIPEVTELMWYLSTITPLWMLEQAHSYKDKVNKWLKANAWLFNYPILMAADILIVNSNLIPIWKDQVQHVEIARDLAKKFNNKYWETFTIPEHKIKSEVQVVPGTDGQKMSKSYWNTIPLFWEEKNIKKAVMSIVTDNKTLEDKKDPDSCNIFTLYKLFASWTKIDEMRENYENWWYWYWDAKKALFEEIKDYFWPMWEKRKDLENEKWIIEKVRNKWAQNMKKYSSEILEACRKAVWIK